MKLQWKSPGREQLNLELKIDGNQIEDIELKAVGSLRFLRLGQKMKRQLIGDIANLAAPEGSSPAEMIWREIIQRIKGEWNFPYKEEELCHCRKVAAKKVDDAIVYGAHTVGEVRKQTSANTGCGTCLPDVQAVLKNRLSA